LNFVDLAFDEATGTAALRAEFPNPQRTLVPGQFVRVRVEAGVQTKGTARPAARGDRHADRRRTCSSSARRISSRRGR
jgi:membrane fusion protein (multidrug efflux system)